ncbi:MAG: VOC family protein [Opitutales bacterium]
MEPYQAPAGLSVGHIHLKVSDLARSEAFYRDVLGLVVTHRYGMQAVFLSAGGYHHHVGLNTWMSRGGQSPAAGTTGLYHAAFLYPTRADLARAVKQVLACGVVLEGAADHGVSHAVYFRDLDDNGIELYWDLPREEWPVDAQGGPEMVTEHLDLIGLLAEAR